MKKTLLPSTSFSAKSGAGFTLIETLVTITIFILALGAMTGLILTSYRTHDYTWQQSMAINEARKGIETMVKEIRGARVGDDGSYPIEKAEDKEFIFYSDIDKDGQTERVRYFLGTVGGSSQIQKCVTFADGGSCSVTFSNFLQGTLESAQVKVTVEGDFGWSKEYAEIFADGNKLGDICKSGCNDCAYIWQGTKTFDVFSQASDDFIQFTANATKYVNAFCDWEEPNHSMKAKFEFEWTESMDGNESDFKKGVINPTGQPPKYPSDQEEVSILSSYIRNEPPIFEYFDEQGNKIQDYPARLKDTKLMKVYLVINVNPERLPQDFELESWTQLRNLKTE